jgi:nucleoside phosphorylase
MIASAIDDHIAHRVTYVNWPNAKEPGWSEEIRAVEREQKRIKRQAVDLSVLRSHEPKVHFGTVASGSLAVASEQMQARLLSLHGKIAASEMEGAGMLAQTFTHEMPTPAILIKGISDHADQMSATGANWRAKIRSASYSP